MAFDVLEARGVVEGCHIPIQVSDPVMDSRILMTDHALVGFEERHIDHIEPDNGHKQANVGFGDIGAEIVWSRLTCKVSFDFVEVVEQVGDGCVVCLLGFGKTTFASDS